MKNPADVARKWARNTTNATESVRSGVQAVTVNPAEKAIARQQAYVDGVQRAVSTGSYARGLRRVTLGDWQNAMITKGIPRIAAGASAATPKMEAFLGQWLPYMDGLKAKLATMPRGGLAENIQRSVAAIEYAAAFKSRQ